MGYAYITYLSDTVSLATWILREDLTITVLRECVITLVSAALYRTPLLDATRYTSFDLLASTIDR